MIVSIVFCKQERQLKRHMQQTSPTDSLQAINLWGIALGLQGWSVDVLARSGLIQRSNSCSQWSLDHSSATSYTQYVVYSCVHLSCDPKAPCEPATGLSVTGSNLDTVWVIVHPPPPHLLVHPHTRISTTNKCSLTDNSHCWSHRQDLSLPHGVHIQPQQALQGTKSMHLQK
jgi:hypothetical protein